VGQEEAITKQALRLNPQGKQDSREGERKAWNSWQWKMDPLQQRETENLRKG